jgi:radical SAM protein with 4Fe4S-binding SPASM domain
MCALSEHERKNSLYKPKNLVVRKVDNFYMALNPDLPNIMVMDDIGKRFFELCDGNLTLDDIVEKILKEKTGSVSKEELFAFVSSMLSANFLFWAEPLPPQKTVQSTQNLLQLYLHITKACNLTCKHCYVEAGSPLKEELSITETLKIIDEFVHLGGEKLIITGGEPFLRKKKLYEIFKKTKQEGIKHIFVETNGTLLSNKDVDVCSKYDVEVAVSLDGAFRETNDFIRGNGNYKKSVSTIKKLANAGVKVRIGMTLMRPNHKEAEKMVILAKDLGVNSISFNVIRPFGRAETHKELLLSIEEMYSSIMTTWKKAKELKVKTSLEDQFESFEKLTRRDLCGAGITTLLVSSNGDVYPCNMFLEFQEFNAGNIRKQPLEDIWKNSEVLKVLRHLSVLDIKGCNVCELKFICGVCPAEIYKNHRNFKRKPELCQLYKELTWNLVKELGRKMWAE